MQTQPPAAPAPAAPQASQFRLALACLMTAPGRAIRLFRDARRQNLGITFWTRRPDLAITPNAGQPTPAPAHPGQPRNPTSDDTRERDPTRVLVDTSTRPDKT